MRELIRLEEQQIQKDKWHLEVQQKALSQLLVDDRLCRQDIILYSSNLLKKLDLKCVIPRTISQITAKANKIEELQFNDSDQLENIKELVNQLAP